MSHVKLWCLELLFTPRGQVSPCYSLLNTTTATQAVWLSTGLSLLPFCPHRGQLSQPQCSTWGTQRHSPITASEGWGGGDHAMSQKGAYTSHLRVISARWGMSLCAAWLVPAPGSPCATISSDLAKGASPSSPSAMVRWAGTAQTWQHTG